MVIHGEVLAMLLEWLQVFYNLGSTKKHQFFDDESEIIKRVYEIFLKEFNIH